MSEEKRKFVLISGHVYSEPDEEDHVTMEGFYVKLNYVTKVREKVDKGSAILNLGEDIVSLSTMEPVTMEDLPPKCGMLVRNNVKEQIRKNPEAVNPPQNLLKIAREWVKYLIVEKDEELLGQIMQTKTQGDGSEPETIRFNTND